MKTNSDINKITFQDLGNREIIGGYHCYQQHKILPKTPIKNIPPLTKNAPIWIELKKVHKYLMTWTLIKKSARFYQYIYILLDVTWHFRPYFI